MTCREIADFLLDYQSDELPAEQRQFFDQHLAECPECVEYIRTYNRTVELGRAAYHDNCAEKPLIPEELVRAILAAQSRP
jgi:anti-sigma factor RsiW